MDENFILDAWQKFDDWAVKQNIILEFIRFNPLKKIITYHIKIQSWNLIDKWEFLILQKENVF